MNIFKFIAYCLFWPLFLHPIGWIILAINHYYGICEDNSNYTEEINHQIEES